MQLFDTINDSKAQALNNQINTIKAGLTGKNTTADRARKQMIQELKKELTPII